MRIVSDMEFARRVYQDRDAALINKFARSCARFLSEMHGDKLHDYCAYLMQLSNTNTRLEEKIIAISFVVLNEPEAFARVFPPRVRDARLMLFLTRVTWHLNNLCNANDTVENVLKEIEIDSIMS